MTTKMPHILQDTGTPALLKDQEVQAGVSDGTLAISQCSDTPQGTLLKQYFRLELINFS